MKRIVPIVALLLASGAAAAVVTRQAQTSRVDLRAVQEVAGEAFSSVDRIGQRLARVSESQEIRIGGRLAGYVQGKEWVVTDSRSAYVGRVGTQLLSSVERPGIPYRFYVVKNPLANAFSLPGGPIFVTTGMLDSLNSEAELAFVLGHEISHIDRRHCIERLQYGLAAEKVGGDLLEEAVRMGYAIYSQGYAKEKEFEADHLGLSLAVAAGYDPREAMTLFRGLAVHDPEPSAGAETPDQELTRALVRGLTDYLRSHPYPRQRVVEIKRLIGIVKDGSPGQRYYVGRRNYQEHRTRRESEFVTEFSLL